jgi:hypothetical protein
MYDVACLSTGQARQLHQICRPARKRPVQKCKEKRLEMEVGLPGLNLEGIALVLQVHASLPVRLLLAIGKP